MAFLCEKLATMKRDIPLPYELEDFRVNINWNEYEKILDDDIKIHRLPSFMSGHPKELENFDELLNRYYGTKYQRPWLSGRLRLYGRVALSDHRLYHRGFVVFGTVPSADGGNRTVYSAS